MNGPRIPSLRLLMGFEAAARHGNFSRAADELSLSQSAVSHQIQQLEAQLGQPLFRRVGRGVELTVAGEVLQRSVQRSVEVLRSGLGRIATYMDPGLVTLVAPAQLLQGWLLPRLGELPQAVPGLCPLFSSDTTARFVDEIDVDLLISDRPLQQPGLLHLPLLRDEWLTVASAALAEQLVPLALDQHGQYTQLLCLEDDLTREPTAAVFRGPLGSLTRRAIFDDARLLLAAVQQGLGLACMSSLLADADLRAGRLLVLPDYPRLPGTQWYLARVAGPARSPFVERWCAWLLAQGEHKAMTP